MERGFLISTILAAALAAVFLTAACSRADRQPAPPPEKMVIAHAALAETAIAQVAQAKGYFADEGLDATPHILPYGKPALDEVLGGRADVAMVAETPFMFAVMNGEKISVIATIQSSNKYHAVIARKDRGIASMRDLRGRRIGVTPGTTSAYFLDAVLATHGISRKNVELVNLEPAGLQAALDNGRIDAASAFHPFLRQAQTRLGGNGIGFYDEDIYTETFNVVAMQEFIRSNPGKVRKLLRGLLRAEGYIRQNPGEAQQAVAAFSRNDIAVIRDLWADSRFAVTLDQSLLLALEDESRWAMKHGLVRAPRVPNYLDYIYLDGLASVKPKAVRILK